MKNRELGTTDIDGGIYAAFDFNLGLDFVQLVSCPSAKYTNNAVGK